MRDQFDQHWPWTHFITYRALNAESIHLLPRLKRWLGNLLWKLNGPDSGRAQFQHRGCGDYDYI